MSRKPLSSLPEPREFLTAVKLVVCPSKSGRAEFCKTHAAIYWRFRVNLLDEKGLSEEGNSDVGNFLVFTTKFREAMVPNKKLNTTILISFKTYKNLIKLEEPLPARVTFMIPGKSVWRRSLIKAGWSKLSAGRHVGQTDREMRDCVTVSPEIDIADCFEEAVHPDLSSYHGLPPLEKQYSDLKRREIPWAYSHDSEVFESFERAIEFQEEEDPPSRVYIPEEEESKSPQKRRAISSSESTQDLPPLANSLTIPISRRFWCEQDELLHPTYYLSTGEPVIPASTGNNDVFSWLFGKDPLPDDITSREFITLRSSFERSIIDKPILALLIDLYQSDKWKGPYIEVLKNYMIPAFSAAWEHHEVLIISLGRSTAVGMRFFISVPRLLRANFTDSQMASVNIPWRNEGVHPLVNGVARESRLFAVSSGLTILGTGLLKGLPLFQRDAEEIIGKFKEKGARQNQTILGASFSFGTKTPDLSAYLHAKQWKNGGEVNAPVPIPGRTFAVSKDTRVSVYELKKGGFVYVLGSRESPFLKPNMDILATQTVGTFTHSSKWTNNLCRLAQQETSVLTSLVVLDDVDARSFLRKIEVATSYGEKDMGAWHVQLRECVLRSFVGEKPIEAVDTVCKTIVDFVEMGLSLGLYNKLVSISLSLNKGKLFKAKQLLTILSGRERSLVHRIQNPPPLVFFRSGTKMKVRSSHVLGSVTPTVFGKEALKKYGEALRKHEISKHTVTAKWHVAKARSARQTFLQGMRLKVMSPLGGSTLDDEKNLSVLYFGFGSQSWPALFRSVKMMKKRNGDIPKTWTMLFDNGGVLVSTDRIHTLQTDLETTWEEAERENITRAVKTITSGSLNRNLANESIEKLRGYSEVGLRKALTNEDEQDVETSTLKAFDAIAQAIASRRSRRRPSRSLCFLAIALSIICAFPKADALDCKSFVPFRNTDMSCLQFCKFINIQEGARCHYARKADRPVSSVTSPVAGVEFSKTSTVQGCEIDYGSCHECNSFTHWSEPNGFSSKFEKTRSPITDVKSDKVVESHGVVVSAKTYICSQPSGEDCSPCLKEEKVKCMLKGNPGRNQLADFKRLYGIEITLSLEEYRRKETPTGGCMCEQVNLSYKKQGKFVLPFETHNCVKHEDRLLVKPMAGAGSIEIFGPQLTADFPVEETVILTHPYEMPKIVSLFENSYPLHSLTTVHRVVHKSNLKHEDMRIVESGDFVGRGKVAGVLSISRQPQQKSRTGRRLLANATTTESMRGTALRVGAKLLDVLKTTGLFTIKSVGEGMPAILEVTGDAVEVLGKFAQIAVTKDRAGIVHVHGEEKPRGIKGTDLWGLWFLNMFGAEFDGPDPDDRMRAGAYVVLMWVFMAVIPVVVWKVTKSITRAVMALVLVFCIPYLSFILTGCIFYAGYWVSVKKMRVPQRFWSKLRLVLDHTLASRACSKLTSMICGKLKITEPALDAIGKMPYMEALNRDGKVLAIREAPSIKTLAKHFRSIDPNSVTEPESIYMEKITFNSIGILDISLLRLFLLSEDMRGGQVNIKSMVNFQVYVFHQKLIGWNWPLFACLGSCKETKTKGYRLLAVFRSQFETIKFGSMGPTGTQIRDAYPECCNSEAVVTYRNTKALDEDGEVVERLSPPKGEVMQLSNKYRAKPMAFKGAWFSNGIHLGVYKVMSLLFMAIVASLPQGDAATLWENNTAVYTNGSYVQPSFFGDHDVTMIGLDDFNTSVAEEKLEKAFGVMIAKTLMSRLRAGVSNEPHVVGARTIEKTPLGIHVNTDFDFTVPPDKILDVTLYKAVDGHNGNQPQPKGTPPGVDYVKDIVNDFSGDKEFVRLWFRQIGVLVGTMADTKGVGTDGTCQETHGSSVCGSAPEGEASVFRKGCGFTSQKPYNCRCLYEESKGGKCIKTAGRSYTPIELCFKPDEGRTIDVKNRYINRLKKGEIVTQSTGFFETVSPKSKKKICDDKCAANVFLHGGTSDMGNIVYVTDSAKKTKELDATFEKDLAAVPWLDDVYRLSDIGDQTAHHIFMGGTYKNGKRVPTFINIQRKTVAGKVVESVLHLSDEEVIINGKLMGQMEISGDSPAVEGYTMVDKRATLFGNVTSSRYRDGPDGDPVEEVSVGGMFLANVKGEVFNNFAAHTTEWDQGTLDQFQAHCDISMSPDGKFSMTAEQSLVSQVVKTPCCSDWLDCPQRVYCLPGVRGNDVAVAGMGGGIIYQILEPRNPMTAKVVIDGTFVVGAIQFASEVTAVGCNNKPSRNVAVASQVKRIVRTGQNALNRLNGKIEREVCIALAPNPPLRVDFGSVLNSGIATVTFSLKTVSVSPDPTAMTQVDLSDDCVGVSRTALIGSLGAKTRGESCESSHNILRSSKLQIPADGQCHEVSVEIQVFSGASSSFFVESYKSWGSDIKTLQEAKNCMCSRGADDPYGPKGTKTMKDPKSNDPNVCKVAMRLLWVYVSGNVLIRQGDTIFQKGHKGFKEGVIDLKPPSFELLTISSIIDAAEGLFLSLVNKIPDHIDLPFGITLPLSPLKSVLGVFAGIGDGLMKAFGSVWSFLDNNWGWFVLAGGLLVAGCIVVAIVAWKISSTPAAIATGVAAKFLGGGRKNE